MFALVSTSSLRMLLTFLSFFRSCIPEIFEENQGSMLMIEIKNSLSGKIKSLISSLFFHFKECKLREFTESTALKLKSVLLSKKSKRVSLKTSCNRPLSRGGHIGQRP